MNIYPYFFLLFLACGFASVGWHLWRAFKTGKISDEIWFGADYHEDHYGFVIRTLGLVILLCVLIWMCFQAPAIFQLFGEEV